jgi:hypothetical protein
MMKTTIPMKTLSFILNAVLISMACLLSSPQATLAQTAPSTPSLYLPLLTREFVYKPFLPIFGVQMDGAINNAEGLAQALDGGSYWVRFDAFAWDLIEPLSTNPPSYHWEAVDQTSLINASQNGMKVVAVVKFIPSWAQKYSGSGCGPIKNEALGKFAEFLSALVNRYKNPPYNIKYWELGNEPDAPMWKARTAYGCWGEVNDPDYGGGYYAQMLQSAYPAIKAADPQAKVLIGGLLLDNPNEAPYNPARFLEGILRGGGGPFFDIVNFHGYAEMGETQGQIRNPNWPGSGTTVSEKVAFIRNVLNRFGLRDKILFNTEAALYCLSETSECLETQSMFIPRAFAEGIAAGLQGVTHYALKCEYRSLGLLRPDNSPRPSYLAYKAASSFLTMARYRGPAAGYPAGIVGFSFYPNSSGNLDLIWSENGALKQVPLPSGSTAFSRYGNPLSPIGGTIAVDYGPVYIQRP